ncbi:MAG: DNA-3-methyladenine glycosylase [Actinomycetota bacterium]
MRALSRTVTSPHPVHLPLTLAPLRHGPGDPTIRLERAGGVWRATRTPEGPATMHLTGTGYRVDADAWGPGASWALEHLTDLVGCEDDPRGFPTPHPLVRSLHRRFAGVRFGRSRAVVESLVPVVLEQKVTSGEAHGSYAAFVRRFGEPAPGPGGLMVQPSPERVARLPYWELHPLGIERRRATVIRAACARAARLEEAGAMAPSDARRRLMALPGVGAWTAAEVARSAFGDVDAVSVGDFHLPHTVAWALAGEPRADDERMLELLEPYGDQRARAVRLIEIGGFRAPRYGPRYAPRSISAI